jgi:hypothetical protein
LITGVSLAILLVAAVASSGVLERSEPSNNRVQASPQGPSVAADLPQARVQASPPRPSVDASLHQVHVRDVLTIYLVRSEEQRVSVMASLAIELTARQGSGLDDRISIEVLLAGAPEDERRADADINEIVGARSDETTRVVDLR